MERAQSTGKKHVRTVITSPSCSLGVPVGPLLQFGARAYALKKSWQDRYQPWREIRDEVVVLGVAILHDYHHLLCSVPGDQKVLLYTDDVVVPSPSADQPVKLMKRWSISTGVHVEHGRGGCLVSKAWLCRRRDAFDAFSPNDPNLFKLEVSSDSWPLKHRSGNPQVKGVPRMPRSQVHQRRTCRAEGRRCPTAQRCGHNALCLLEPQSGGSACEQL